LILENPDVELLEQRELAMTPNSIFFSKVPFSPEDERVQIFIKLFPNSFKFTNQISKHLIAKNIQYFSNWNGYLDQNL